MKSDEINEKAVVFEPPFVISPRQVTYYRKSRKADLTAILAAGEQAALTEGLALVGVRVTKLKQLAALMERDIFGGFLWLEQIKGVGSGDVARLVEYEEFNKAEVDALRGVYDDIAKEMGGRKTELKHSGEIRDDGGIAADQHARAIIAFYEALRVSLHRPDAAKSNNVDTAQSTAMAGATDAG